MTTRNVVSTGVLYSQGKAWLDGQVVSRLLAYFATDDFTHPADSQTWDIDIDGTFTMTLVVPDTGTVLYEFVLPSGETFQSYIGDGVSDLAFEALVAGSGGEPEDIESFQTMIDASLAVLDLDDLRDVNAAAPSDGQVLTWDSGTSRWVAENASGGSPDITDLGATGWLDGESVEWDAGTGAFIRVVYAKLTGATFSGGVYVPIGGLSVLGITNDRGMGSGGGAYVHLTGGGGVLNLSGNGAGIGNGLKFGWGAISTGATASDPDTYFGRTADGQIYLAGAASGSQTRFAFYVDSSTTADQQAGYIGTDWTDTTHATRTSRMRFFGVLSAADLELAQFDPDCAAGETSLWLYDKDNDTLERVTVGAADSGGSGYKALRIPN